MNQSLCEAASVGGLVGVGDVLIPSPCPNFNFRVSQFALDCSRFRLHALRGS
jgi:hypothetical protein